MQNFPFEIRNINHLFFPNIIRRYEFTDIELELHDHDSSKFCLKTCEQSHFLNSFSLGVLRVRSNLINLT